MKKIILIITIMSSFILSSETYYINTNNGQKITDVIVRDLSATQQEHLTCELPEVLNNEGTACEIPTPNCTLPDVLNETGEACINNIVAVDWIDTSDTCGGMRQANFDSNVYFARAISIESNPELEIPQGYRWITSYEYTTLFNQSTVQNKHSTILVYRGQCGHQDYPRSLIENQNQNVVLFSNNATVGIHVGNAELLGTTHSNYSPINRFFGYVLYREY